MGLSNSASRARLYTSTTNQPNGGGSKKAGFPNMIGRTAWTSIYLGQTKPGNGNCCQLKSLQFTKFPNVKQSRPIDSRVGNSYF